MIVDNKKVFIDTAPFIYFVEGNSKESIKARDMFFKLLKSECKIITSMISDLEFKVLSKRENQERKIFAFESFLESFDIKRMYITNQTYKLALAIRVNYHGIKLIDALQLAIAQEHNCDYFVTNDKQLLQFKGLKCVLFDKI